MLKSLRDWHTVPGVKSCSSQDTIDMTVAVSPDPRDVARNLILETVYTRKPCYRKGDRAMRRTYAWPGQFRKSLATPMATVAEIVNGPLLRWIV